MSVVGVGEGRRLNLTGVRHMPRPGWRFAQPLVDPAIHPHFPPPNGGRKHRPIIDPSDTVGLIARPVRRAVA